jgi:Xaa-Pro aminopeptidase
MPVAEFQRRADRLRASMSDAGLDAMLLYGRGLNECGHPTYLANYVVKLPFAALVVLPSEGEPALMFEGATRGRDAAKATTWIDDVRPCWNIAETCLSVLADRGLTTKRIGLAGMPRLVPYDQWRLLRDGLAGATVSDAEAIVEHQRAVKSPLEIVQLRRASEIAAIALTSAARVPRARATELDLASEVVRGARYAGAEDIRVMIARPHEIGWAFRPPEGRRLDADTFVLHLAVSRERYWCEAMRTFRVRAGVIERVWTDDLDERYRALVAAFRPGTIVRDAVRGAREPLSPEEWRALEMCGLGHGIGVTPEETPVLSDNSFDTLQSGMALVLRAALRSADGLVVYADTTVL